MRVVPPEILSTARPTKVRLAGFLCLAAGAILAGIGATRVWAVIGFPDDLQHAADAPVHGTDVWEGKAILLGAAAALVAMLAMRLARSGTVRRFLAILLIGIGLATTVIAGMDAVRAKEHFGGQAGEDLYVTWLAQQTDLPEDVIREQLSEQFSKALRVDVGAGIWLCLAGGVLLVVGGALSLVWIHQREASARAATDEESPEP
jgi:hypothetical protein